MAVTGHMFCFFAENQAKYTLNTIHIIHVVSDFLKGHLTVKAL